MQNKKWRTFSPPRDEGGMTVSDGYLVWQFPEFIAVRDLFLAPMPSKTCILDLPNTDEQPYMEVDGTKYFYSTGLSFDFYHLQEFKDFCGALGIDWESFTKSMQFEFSEGVHPTVSHVYAFPVVSKQELIQADTPTYASAGSKQ